jgi:hypothetical protein
MPQSIIQLKCPTEKSSEIETEADGPVHGVSNQPLVALSENERATLVLPYPLNFC